MSDRISIVYDANIDSLNNKLNEIIQKNILVKGSVDEATKSLKNMADALQKHASKVQINIDNSQDFRNILNEVTKVTIDNREITKTATSTTEKNTQATEKSTKAKNEQSRALKVNTDNSRDNSIRLTQNNKVHHDYSRTLNQTTNNITRLNAKFIENNKHIEDNRTYIKNITDSFNRYSGGAVSATRSLLGFSGILGQLQARLLAFIAIDKLVELGKAVIEVERNFEILQNRINFVAGTTTGGEAVFGRLQKTANDLGIGIQELTEGFSGFAIAAKMAGFSSAAAEDIFSKVATALRAAGASSLQTQRAFYALQQMLSKGVVAAEELRRQLGEALPGASDLMTRAYNRLHPGQELTNRQFTKMLEEGKIISAEILPEFARVLQEEFGPALSGKKNSLDAILTRISNQFLELKKNLGNLDFIKNAFGGLATFLTDINNVMTNEELTFKEKVDGFMRAGTRLNQFEIEKNKKLAAQGSFLAQYYLDGQRVLEESEKKAQKRIEDQTKREKELISLAEKQYVAYKKLGEIEQSRFETSLQMRITLSDKDISELSSESKAIRDLYSEIGQVLGITAKQWNMYAEAGRDDVMDKIAERIKEIFIANKAVTEQELNAAKSFDNRLKQKKQELKNIIATTKASQEQDKALLDLIKTKRIADSQGGPGGGDGTDLQKKAIESARELVALEQTRLLKITEGTTEYGDQLAKVIEARKALVRLERAGTPKQMGLELANLDKELENYTKKINENVKKENDRLREAELDMAISTAKGVVDAAEKGTKERLMAERELARQVAKLELFKVSISTDSEELKALKIKLINTELFNKLTSLSVDYVKSQKEAQDKIVEKTQEAHDRIIDIIQEANDLIERNEGDSFQRRLARSNQMFEDMARKLREEMGNTEDFELLEALKKKLGEVEEAGKKAATQLTMSEVGKMISEIGDIYGEIANRQSVLYENEQNNLKKMLDDKLISEEEYNRRSLDLKKKQFNQEKQTAIIKAIIDGASAIMKSLITPWQIPLILGMTAAQISTISAQQFPGYKEGVIDLKGPGSETSDSITARLSRGESVMTAEETRQYKPVLQAIRDGEFEAFVAKRYTSAMQKQDVALNTGGSFADNVSNSFDMQTAELATLLKQNRKVAIKNVDELAKAINRRGTAHKVIDRRTLR
jgi:tape measure domain-containing protein